MAEWNNTLKEWLCDTGACWAAGLANVTDCNYYAVAAADKDGAPLEEAHAWASLFSDPHEVTMTQEDGSEAPIMVTESEKLWMAVDTGMCPGGIFIGKDKYRVVQFEDLTLGDQECRWIFASKSKGGCHIIKTPKSVVTCLYDENIGQSSGNAKNAAIQFGEYIAGAGL